MRRITLLSLLFICLAGRLFAKAGDCCHTTIFDVVENMTKNCGSLDDTHAPQNVYIQNNKVAFLTFPNARRCERKASGNYTLHPSQVTICTAQGYTVANSIGTNRNRFDPVADQANQCWKWQCKNGFVQQGNGECLTPEEACAKDGRRFANGMCVENWCSGWTGKNDSQHYDFLVGNCYQYRCSNGKAFRSAADRTCVDCSDQEGTRGGQYWNEGSAGSDVGGNWVCNKCEDNQYVKSSGGRLGCESVRSADDARIKSCWRCKENKFRECMQSGNGAGANASACPDNVTATTVATVAAVDAVLSAATGGGG